MTPKGTVTFLIKRPLSFWYSLRTIFTGSFSSITSSMPLAMASILDSLSLSLSNITSEILSLALMRSVSLFFSIKSLLSLNVWAIYFRALFFLSVLRFDISPVQFLAFSSISFIVVSSWNGFLPVCCRLHHIEHLDCCRWWWPFRSLSPCRYGQH